MRLDETRLTILAQYYWAIQNFEILSRMKAKTTTQFQIFIQAARCSAL